MGSISAMSCPALTVDPISTCSFLELARDLGADVDVVPRLEDAGRGHRVLEVASLHRGDGVLPGRGGMRRPRASAVDAPGGEREHRRERRRPRAPTGAEGARRARSRQGVPLNV